MTTDDLAGILAEHGQLGMVRQDDGSFRWECICGEGLPEDPELVEDAHYAHQAAVIAAAGWVQGRREEWATGIPTGGTRIAIITHVSEASARWRASQPEEFGPLEVIRRIVTDWEPVE